MFIAENQGFEGLQPDSGSSSTRGSRSAAGGSTPPRSPYKGNKPERMKLSMQREKQARVQADTLRRQMQEPGLEVFVERTLYEYINTFYVQKIQRP